LRIVLVVGKLMIFILQCLNELVCAEFVTISILNLEDLHRGVKKYLTT